MAKHSYPVINDLRTLLDGNEIEAADREFVLSLVTRAEKYGVLSEKQLFWAGEKLKVALFGRPEPEAVDLGNTLAPMVAMLTFAKQHLKWPKVSLMTESGAKVVLSLAGPKAKHPGSINVTDGGPYMDNVWYGRIYADGKFEHGAKAAKSDTMKDVDALLIKFAADPVQGASAYGALTGNCCFCNKKLSDEKSTKVGYGKVCAGHFNLPWGEK